MINDFNKENKKVQFCKASKYNGVVYKTGRISFSPIKLEEFGITEEEPDIKIEYDYAKKQIIISGIYN